MPHFNSVLCLSAECASRLARRGMKFALRCEAVNGHACGPAPAAGVRVGPLRALPVLCAHRTATSFAAASHPQDQRRE